MDNYIQETPNLATEWCPVCQPDKDPSREILQVRHCFMHDAALIGSADALVAPPECSTWSAPGEAGGEENRRINDLLRGGVLEQSVNVTLWLIWSLVSGQPADVDSFLDRNQCEASLLQGMTNLEHNRDAAKAGNAPKEVLDKLDSLSFYGCTEAHVVFQRKDS